MQMKKMNMTIKSIDGVMNALFSNLTKGLETGCGIWKWNGNGNEIKLFLLTTLVLNGENCEK